MITKLFPKKKKEKKNTADTFIEWMVWLAYMREVLVALGATFDQCVDNRKFLV